MEMETNNAQTSRISLMEQHLDNATTAVKGLEAALDEYYGSDQWRQDLDDDEAGRLPEGLKRGVLSQDGIWNLLDDCRALNTRLLHFAQDHCRQ